MPADAVECNRAVCQAPNPAVQDHRCGVSGTFIAAGYRAAERKCHAGNIAGRSANADADARGGWGNHDLAADNTND